MQTQAFFKQVLTFFEGDTNFISEPQQKTVEVISLLIASTPPGEIRKDTYIGWSFDEIKKELPVTLTFEDFKNLYTQCYLVYKGSMYKDTQPKQQIVHAVQPEIESTVVLPTNDFSHLVEEMKNFPDDGTAEDVMGASMHQMPAVDRRAPKKK